MGTGKAGHQDSGSFTIAVHLKISFGKRVLSLPTSKLVDPAVIGGKVGFEGSHQRELVKCGGLKCPGLALPAALSLAAWPSPRWSHVRPCSLLPGGLESSPAAVSPGVSHLALRLRGLLPSGLASGPSRRAVSFPSCSIATASGPRPSRPSATLLQAPF